jgi:acyl-CoA synthetase (AMP-forming)/AMP-acid ligase II
VLCHTIVDQVRMNAQAFPERVAIEVLGGESLTYGEVWRRVTGLADALAGVEERDPHKLVAIMLPNGPDAVLTQLACQLAGCVAVPMNVAFKLAEMNGIIADSGARTVLTADPYLEMAGRLESAPAVIDCATVPLSETFSDRRAPGGDDEPMVVYYTSGTTGLPKGAVFSNGAMYLRFVRWGWTFGLRSDDVVLTCGPMFHGSYGGLVLVGLTIGARSRIMTKFDAATAYHELRDRSTFAFLVPTMMRAVVDVWETESKAPAVAARTLLSSGAAISAELLAQAIEVFPNATISEGYGWSEGNWVCFERKTLEDLKPQSVGRPMVGADVRILRPDRSPCDVGEPGEIAARDLVLFSGYLHRPQETAAAMHDGYALSGDIGVLDPDGRVRLLDRKKDMIVTGGENVYPAEVERVLMSHPDLVEAAVVGRPDPRWGEAVVAVVVSARPELTGEDLQTYCREYMAGYKVPKQVEIVSELPRNAMGKVQKFLVRDLLGTAAGSANAART